MRSALASTAVALTSVVVLASACDEAGIVGARDQSQDIDCSIPVSDVHRGAFRGAIPALTNPDLVHFGESGAQYFGSEDRVVGMMIDGQPIAIPLNIFWWHEIVNLDTDEGPVAVTHCPLTGSTLAFDRSAVGGVGFEVSGLLYQNNLMMADLSADSESLWPQMARTARCGPKDGMSLPMLPVIEMTWGAWNELHPTSKVVASNTGHVRDYTEYPYDDYADTGNEYTLFPVGRIDDRRPPKERVLGIPDGAGGLAFPFGELRAAGYSAAIHGSTSEGEYVVFWDRLAEGAAAFRPVHEGQVLTFRAEAGKIFDEQTGSRWLLDGVAVEGALAGAALEPVAEAFVAFWFAWPLFYPQVEVWTA